MAEKKYVSARDGENNSVIYVDADGSEFLHSGGTRAWRNNNPGNLIASEKSGLSIGKGGRFAAFANHEDGVKALKYSLTHFYSNRKLDEVFKKYAPASDRNDPDHYLKLVKDFSGLDSSRTIGSLNENELTKFAAAIQRVEGWKAGKVELIPHARQFEVKGIDGSPLCGLFYELSFFDCKGKEKKVSGKTDDRGMTAIAETDTASPVTLKLPRPDPGQSLKSTNIKARPEAGGQKQVVAAQAKAKPWYDSAFKRAEKSEDPKNDEISEEALKKQANNAESTLAKPPTAPIAVVRQSGAVKPSLTKEKGKNHIEQVVKEAGVFVTWEFNTEQGSGKDLNKLPYFIAEMSDGTGKPLVEGQQIHLLTNKKIRQKVPYGKEVALYLGNDAKSKYRRTPLYRVKAEEGLTDIVIKISEIKGRIYDADEEIPSGATVTGTKKVFTASMFGTTWMKFSHRFNEAEALAECIDEKEELKLALKDIFRGAPVVAGNSISLNIVKPNKEVLKIVWRSTAFDNCRGNIPAVNGMEFAKNELITRVHPQTYKAFLKAAFELDAEEMEIASGWRPMLGSVLHRVGVGLDVSQIKVKGETRGFRRSMTPAEREYKAMTNEKKGLLKKKNLSADEISRLNQINAIDSQKNKVARDSVRQADVPVLRSFVALLRNNGDVKQTFDPWEMDVNTADDHAAETNRLVTSNETLHVNHLHITVKDVDLGY
ncbi:hypothetical protein [Massilia sp. TN1-12]|uniref:hypothetical protein n=1 Tax=Massilia paldalensis TaxID=3377675 RepID=UPI003850CD40